MERIGPRNGKRQIIEGGRWVNACEGIDENGNKCPKSARNGSTKCIGCTTGFNRHALTNHEIGEEFIGNSIRYRQGVGQLRKLCIGDNNTCKKSRTGGEYGLYCVGCFNNSGKIHHNGRKKGDSVTVRGEKKVFNGVQLIIPCKSIDCDQPSVYEGECKSHSEHWRCRYTEKKCGHIRDKSGYCVRHQNNIFNPRSISKGELAIMKWFNDEDLDYEHNPTVKFEDRNMRPDFIFTYYNLVIEFDGDQHFNSKSNWGGDDAYLDRVESDLRKDRWAAENGYHMLRIATRNKRDLIKIIVYCVLMIQELDPRTPPCAFSSDFVGYADRDYITIKLPAKPIEIIDTEELIISDAPIIDTTDNVDTVDTATNIIVTKPKKPRVIKPKVIKEPKEPKIIAPKTCKYVIDPACPNIPLGRKNNCEEHQKKPKPIIIKPKIGDTRTHHNDGRQYYDGSTWRKFCKVENSRFGPCNNIPISAKGFCAKHSAINKCGFDNCPDTHAAGSSYCAFHKGGMILEDKEGAQRIIEYLCDRNISYGYDIVETINGETLCPEFALFNPKLIIDFDNANHDDSKPALLGYHLLRISREDVNNIYEIIDQTLSALKDIANDSPRFIFAHKCEEYIDRGYIDVPI